MHCKHCQVCAKQKVKKTKFIKDNFRLGSMPMEFISMDLVGRLSRTSSGHEYALTVICMLTGYMFCIPPKNKSAKEIVDKYLAHVAFTFGNSRKILSDNSTEKSEKPVKSLLHGYKNSVTGDSIKMFQ